MTSNPRNFGFATRAIHVGHDPAYRPEDGTQSITVPIYQTSTYVQNTVGDPDPAYEYARVQNPTRAALEKNMAALESGKSAHAFASGMAAIVAIMSILRPGDEVIVSHDVYGGTNRYFTHSLERWGVGFHWIDTTDSNHVAETVRANPNARMIFIETPSNPTMEITDIAAVASIAHENGLLLVVDNTFLSSYNQRPIELGADLVMHSTTKYLNGHSDSLGGIVVVSPDIDPEVISQRLEGALSDDMSSHLGYVQKAAGPILAPFECFLILRGLRTLAIRMEKHEENGRAIAAYLANEHKERPTLVRRVLYPGLEDHPGHEVQTRQTTGEGRYGAMISIDLGTMEAARRFLLAIDVISLAESLGGVESLACHPATMTHASISAREREELGISDGLVRLSIGIEDIDDLIADVEQAIEAASEA
ncbi:MAG: PLP-dependent aspartate aminotransferase family protein [Acidobacteriota bacterium]